MIPTVGPSGAVGGKMVSPASTVTLSPGDISDTTWVLAAERACAVTVKVPGHSQLRETLVVPTASHGVFVPSPQNSLYWTWFPKLDVAPPVE